MTPVLLSIGSNLKFPVEQLVHAFHKLQQRYQQVHMSELVLSEPVGGVPQEPFVNAAIYLETHTTSTVLLDTLQELEQQAGRDRELEIPKGPRPLDIDIILFGAEIHQEEQLMIPHPRFRDRRFVLAPAAEVAGELRDPITGKSIAELLEVCNDHSWVRKLESEPLPV